jgi:hypothetical protein
MELFIVFLIPVTEKEKELCSHWYDRRQNSELEERNDDRRMEGIEKLATNVLQKQMFMFIFLNRSKYSWLFPDTSQRLLTGTRLPCSNASQRLLTGMYPITVFEWLLSDFSPVPDYRDVDVGCLSTGNSGVL